MAGDSVADEFGFIRTYMSSHPDILVEYAEWYGQVTEPISSVEMLAVDTKGMTLSCKLKNGKTKEVRIPIDPPMTRYDEDDAKPRLLEMKARAQEGLGMIKTPKVTTFRFPLAALQVLFIVHPILAYFAYAPVDNPSVLYLPARLLAKYAGSSAGYWGFWSCNVIHVFEALYTWSLCRKYVSGFFVSTVYVLSTVVCGFYIWKDLQMRIRDARMKAE